MSSLNLFGNEWLNIVFQDRNKIYGAYQLRKESSKITFIALAIGLTLLSFVFTGPMLLSSKISNVIVSTEPTEELITSIVNIVDVAPKVTAPSTITKGKEVSVKPTVKDVMANRKFVDITVSASNTIVTDNLAAQSDFNDHVNAGQSTTEAFTNGTLNTTGAASSNVNTGNTLNSGNGNIIGGSSNEVENKIVHLVQKKAAPQEGFEQFFESFIKRFSISSINSSADVMIVKLKFVVEKDGSFTDIKILEDKHGLGNEAVRVLNTMPKWKPAQHNGKSVRSAFTLPIRVRNNN